MRTRLYYLIVILQPPPLDEIQNISHTQIYCLNMGLTLTEGVRITWPTLTNINNHKLKFELILSSLKICPPILQVPFMIYCEGAVSTVLQNSHPHLLRFINIVPCISPINHRNDSPGTQDTVFPGPLNHLTVNSRPLILSVFGDSRTYYRHSPSDSFCPF